MRGTEATVSQLVGQTLTDIKGAIKGSDEITFVSKDGSEYTMFHYQDCCENVDIQDIVGDIEDLIDTPILEAEEVTSQENPEDVHIDWQDSFTWTFYKFATIKGRVTIRWYGESNGYYSESVSMNKTKGAN